VEEGGLEPPYCGVVHEMHLDETNRRLGPLEVLERVGPYVVWRQTEARALREPAGEG